MLHRMSKNVNVIAYCALSVVTVLLVAGQLALSIDEGAIIVGGIWLIVTELDYRSLLRTYLFITSRLRVVVPLLFGAGLCVVALSGGSILIDCIAAGQLLAWLGLFLAFRRNGKLLYFKEGYGPLPRGAMIDPPVEMLRPGDLILTNGRNFGGVAKIAHEGVGHGEVVLRSPDGALCTLTSLMAKGALIQPVETVAVQKAHGHFIVLRLAGQPFTSDDEKIAWDLAQKMVAENQRYKARANARLDRLFAALPARLRNVAAHRVQVTGYDFAGLVFSRLAPDKWTCIGACLELYRRMAIDMRPYGGIFGLGTIMPIGTLELSAFELLRDTRQGLSH